MYTQTDDEVFSQQIEAPDSQESLWAHSDDQDLCLLVSANKHDRDGPYNDYCSDVLHYRFRLGSGRQKITDKNEDSTDSCKGMNVIPRGVLVQKKERHAIQQPDWYPQGSDQVKNEHSQYAQSTYNDCGRGPTT